MSTHTNDTRVTTQSGVTLHIPEIVIRIMRYQRYRYKTTCDIINKIKQPKVTKKEAIELANYINQLLKRIESVLDAYHKVDQNSPEEVKKISNILAKLKYELNALTTTFDNL